MAPAEKVYRIMADVNNWHSWHPEVEAPEITNSFIPGHSFTWKSGGLNIKSTIHTATAYSKLGWSGRAFGAFAIHNWAFLPKGTYTEVIVTESMEGWLVSLMKSKFKEVWNIPWMCGSAALRSKPKNNAPFLVSFQPARYRFCYRHVSGTQL